MNEYISKPTTDSLGQKDPYLVGSSGCQNCAYGLCVGLGGEGSDQTNSGFWRKSGSKNNSLCLWGLPAGLGSVFLSSTHCNGEENFHRIVGPGWDLENELPSCCRDGKKAPWQRGRWEKAGDWEHESCVYRTMGWSGCLWQSAVWGWREIRVESNWETCSTKFLLPCIHSTTLRWLKGFRQYFFRHWVIGIIQD